MQVDLRSLIEDVILKFNQNRTGPKPIIFATIPPDLRRVYWDDDGLERFVKYFLYHALLTNSPEKPIHIIVHERTQLVDLEEFVSVAPPYWVQLRIQGDGSGVILSMVEEIFDDLGYRCEEWVAVEGCGAQLGIFRPTHKEVPKMVFCVDAGRAMRCCDFLIPVPEAELQPSLVPPRKNT